MKLSILDYAVIDKNKTVQEAICESVELAQLAERLGYKRFWIAEHHNISAFASTSPELLMLHLLNNTKTIQIGSGGIMLPHYSPYKIAEWTKLLSSFYPNRVNLGIGNNPGTKMVQNMLKTKILTNEEYNERCEQLTNILYKNEITIHPKEAKIEPFWILSTSEKSAKLAARLGQNYVYGLFLNQVDNYLEIAKKCLDTYRNEALKKGSKSSEIVAVFVIIGENEKEAQDLARCLDIWLLGKKEFNEFSHYPSIDTAKNYKLSDFDKERIEKNRTRLVYGTDKQVAEKLRKLARKLDVEEIMCVPLMPTIEKRKKTLELLARELLQK